MRIILGILVIVVLGCPFVVFAQVDSTKTSIADLNKERQNPLSGLRSIYFQDYILPISEVTANSFSVQPVFPIKITDKIKLVTYTIIPFQWIPPLSDTVNSVSGLGNILFNGYFAPINKKSKIIWGIGPAIQLPTRTNPSLGSNRVSLGPAGLLYYEGAKFSGGLVLQNYWSLGGTGSNKVNVFSLQYLAYYNFPHEWFLESNSTIMANWLSEPGNMWTVPVGGGLGKTFKIGKSKLFYSAATQAFYNIVKPDALGNWAVILQFQIIFSS